MSRVIAFLKEFKICAKAVMGFAAGYKYGEGYELGKLEAPWGKRLDAEAWVMGKNLAAKRGSWKESTFDGN